MIAKAAPPGGKHGPDASTLAAMAAVVRTGTVNVDALNAKVALAHPSADRAASTAAALQTLHDTLTTAQRSALVAAVSTRMANGGPKGPPPDMAGGPSHVHGPMGHMLADLALTDAQQAAIDTALAAGRPAPPSAEEMKTHFDAMRAETKTKLQTFAADSFDAVAFVAPPSTTPGMAGMPRPEDHAARMASDLAAISAVLQPAQREKLALRIEQGQDAH